MQSSIPSRDSRVGIDRTIQFPKSLLHMRSSGSLQLQALCISTQDGPPPRPPANGEPHPPLHRAAPQHRFHWPARSELHLGINSPVRLTTRASKIGINGRDSPVNVMPHVTSTGILKIGFYGNGDPAQFLFGLRIAEPRPLLVRFMCDCTVCNHARHASALTAKLVRLHLSHLCLCLGCGALASGRSIWLQTI